MGGVRAELELPQWLAGHVGWLAEYWIGRNPQRNLPVALIWPRAVLPTTCR